MIRNVFWENRTTQEVHNRMKLIYLYVKKFKVFSNREFRLDSEFEIHYETNNGRLTIQRRAGLKPDFWFLGVSPTKSPVVESVSAIVGENGSGKTTFAQILLELFRGSGVQDFECIAVLEIGGRLSYYRTAGLDVSLEFDSSISISPDPVPISILMSELKYCYYSPVYTTERDRGRDLWDDGDTCYDLSTTGLLLSYVRELNVRDKDVFTAFDIDEKRRVLEFLSFVENTRHQLPERTPDFPIRYPVAVWLEIEKLAIQRARDAITRRQEVFHGSGGDSSAEITHAEKGCLTVLDRVMALSEKMSSLDFFVKAFMSYGFLHLYDLNLTQFSSLGAAEDIELLDFLESISDSKDLPSNIRRQIFAYLEEHPPKRKRNGQIANDRDGRTVFRTFRCLQSLIEMQSVEEQNGLIVLPLDNRIVRRKLLELVELHEEASIISMFLRFSFPHAISSGEMAFLSMFGRLYERFSKFDSVEGLRRGKTDALVFIDEAETTLHPCFQRDLVYNVIWFFETFFPRAKVHLLFATHSPILLSDIPKLNCEFLFRTSQDGNECAKKSELGRLRNTFGANIFDLYRLSYFMEHGTIGKFATEKINRVLRLLNNNISGIQNPQNVSPMQLSQTEWDEIKEILSLIGDTFITQYIDIGLRSAGREWQSKAGEKEGVR